MSTPNPTSPIDPTPFQTRLRALCDTLALHERDAAALLGVPYPTLRNWLYGHREPAAGIERLLDIIEALALFAPAMLAQWVPQTPYAPGKRGRRRTDAA